MKKFISSLLVMLMACSMCMTAFAASFPTSGDNSVTKVSYTGEGEEYYEINVPSTLAPGAGSYVYAEGTWASNRQLNVTADETVTLTNDIDGSTKVLDVTFAGISKTGDNTVQKTYSEQISVADISDALFGTWTGTINYTVTMEDVTVSLRS